MTASDSQPTRRQETVVDSIHASGPRRLSASLTRTIWVAAGFCVLVSLAMLYQHHIAAERDPWKSPQLLALKAKLRAAPANDPLKKEIRRLDFEFRQRYVRRLSLNRTGGWLLVGGMAMMLLAAKQSVKLQTKPWLPKLKSESAKEVRQRSSRSRRSVLGISAVIVLGLAALAFTAGSPLPRTTAELDKLLGRSSEGGAVTDALSLAEFQANWPRFRGLDGGGVSAFTNLPLTQDGKTGVNVLWKSPVPAPGFNSPVVWGNRVFVSGGDAVKRELFCYDAADGGLLWRRAITNVPGSPAKQPEIAEVPGFAAPTTACDGRRVFVLFANGDLAALTLDGAPAWSKSIGVPRNTYGHAASLAIWPGKLIVQLDQDQNAPGGSKLLAFDCASGRQLWERSKPTHGSWATPIIIEAAGKIQIITLALPFVMSHSLVDGNELWRAELLDGEITPSPIFAGGLVIVISPSSTLAAIRPDGAGDVTRSHLAWTAIDNVPDVTSPVSNGELVFAVTSAGLLTCFTATDGKKVWEKDLGMEVQSSPAIAGGQLLLLSTRGDVVVAEAARAFKELSRGKLDDVFYASPSFHDGKVYLRGAKTLFCLGPSGERLAKQK